MSESSIRHFGEEQTIRHISDPPDPVRVEIKENAKGEPQVSVRVTGENKDLVLEDAMTLYWKAKVGLADEE